MTHEQAARAVCEQKCGHGNSCDRFTVHTEDHESRCCFWLTPHVRKNESDARRRFPVLKGGSIPRAVAELAYIEYCQQHGNSQSIERMAERGGFGTEELDVFVPNWRSLVALNERNATLPSSGAEALLRHEWWLNHHCPISALYGDDGEMQCGRCVVDFGREALEILHRHVQTRRLAAVSTPDEIATLTAKLNDVLHSSICTKCGWRGVPTVVRPIGKAWGCGNPDCGYLVNEPKAAIIERLTGELKGAQQRERIVAAAIVDHADLTNSLPPPARHHTLIHAMAERGDPKPINGEQGFITSAGRFVNREEAMSIAVEAGQVDATRTGYLFSEDLW